MEQHHIIVFLYDVLLETVRNNINLIPLRDDVKRLVHGEATLKEAADQNYSSSIGSLLHLQDHYDNPVPHLEKIPKKKVSSNLKLLHHFLLLRALPTSIR